MYKILVPRFRSRCLEDMLQPDFAKHFNKSVATVSRWINNPESLTLKQFLAICDFINADHNEFIESRKDG